MGWYGFHIQVHVYVINTHPKAVAEINTYIMRVHPHKHIKRHVRHVKYDDWLSVRVHARMHSVCDLHPKKRSSIIINIDYADADDADVFVYTRCV